MIHFKHQEGLWTPSRFWPREQREQSCAPPFGAHTTSLPRRDLLGPCSRGGAALPCELQERVRPTHVLTLCVQSATGAGTAHPNSPHAEYSFLISLQWMRAVSPQTRPRFSGFSGSGESGRAHIKENSLTEISLVMKIHHERSAVFKYLHEGFSHDGHNSDSLLC